MNPQFEELSDNNEAICPYCNVSYQVETEDYDEDEREDTCENCGQKYWLSEYFSVTHNTRPDCELNGTEHNYEIITFSSGGKGQFCTVCNDCQIYKGEVEDYG